MKASGKKRFWWQRQQPACSAASCPRPAWRRLNPQTPSHLSAGSCWRLSGNRGHSWRTTCCDKVSKWSIAVQNAAARFLAATFGSFAGESLGKRARAVPSANPFLQDKRSLRSGEPETEPLKIAYQCAHHGRPFVSRYYVMSFVNTLSSHEEHPLDAGCAPRHLLDCLPLRHGAGSRAEYLRISFDTQNTHQLDIK